MSDCIDSTPIIDTIMGLNRLRIIPTLYQMNVDYFANMIDKLSESMTQDDINVYIKPVASALYEVVQK